MKIRTLHNKRKLDDLLWRTVNCPNKLRIEKTAEYFKVHVEPDHSNITSGSDLTALLEGLKHLGIVADSVKTVWVGMHNGKFVIWCSRQ